MTARFAQRLLAAIPVLLVTSVLAFALQAMAPGDPAYLLLQASGRQTITDQDVALKRAELHLDDPLPIRYLSWLGGAVRGDFGRSFRSSTPLLQLYAERIVNTALLAGASVILGMLVAIPLGTVAAYRRGSATDRIAQLVAVIGSAVPGFWIALVFIFFLSAQLACAAGAWHSHTALGKTPVGSGVFISSVVASSAVNWEFLLISASPLG